MMEMIGRRKLMTFAIVLSLVLAALSAVWFAQPAKAYAAAPEALSGKVTNLEDLMVNYHDFDANVVKSNVKSNFSSSATDNNIILPQQLPSTQSCLEISGPYTDKAVKFRFIATSDLDLGVLSRATGTVGLNSWTGTDAYIVQIERTRARLYGFGHGKNGVEKTYTSQLTVGDTYTVTYGTYDDGDDVNAYFCLESEQAVIVEYTHTYTGTAAVKTGGNFRILNNVKSNVKILGAEGIAMKTQYTYSYTGITWDNRVVPDTECREVLVTFRRCVFDIKGILNKTNWLVDENSEASKKIKLNGVALGELYKTNQNYVVDYNQGAGHIYIRYPASAVAATTDYPFATLSFEAGMQFYFGIVTETTLYLENGSWSNAKPLPPQDVNFSGYGDNYGWNNKGGIETLLTFSSATSTGFQKKSDLNLASKATSDAATKIRLNGKTLGTWYSEDTANIILSTTQNQSWIYLKYKPAILVPTQEYPITQLDILSGTLIHYGTIKDGLTLYLVNGFWTKDKPETVSDALLDNYRKYTISDMLPDDTTSVELKGSTGAGQTWNNCQLMGEVSGVIVTDIKFSSVSGDNKPSPQFYFRGKKANGTEGITFYLAGNYRGAYGTALLKVDNATGTNNGNLLTHPFILQNDATYRFEMGVIELRNGSGIYIYLKLDGKLIFGKTFNLSIPSGGQYFGAFSNTNGIDITMSSIDEKAPVINYTGKTAIKKVKNTNKLSFDVSATDYTGINFAKATAEVITPTITWSNGALDGSDKLLTGNHTVTITASDAAGNEAEPVVITVTVVDADTEAPEITYTGPLTLNLDKGDAKPIITATAADDIDETVNVVITYSQGMLDSNNKLLVGIHTITLTASDAAGNAATQKVITVNVPDVTPPVINYTGSLTLNLDKGDAKPVITATATDDVDGTVTVVITYSQDMLDSNDKVLAGTHKITLTASDAAGNAATQKVITVNVVDPDVTPPVINYTGKLTLNLKVGNKKPVITADATDTVDGNVNIVVLYSEGMLDESGNVLEGTHTITLSAQDAAGNKAQDIVITVVVTPEDTGAKGCNSSVANNILPLALVCMLLSFLFILRKKSVSKK